MERQKVRVEQERDGALWRVVLSRPAVRNAHDTATFRELVAALDEAEADRSCRCVVLTGEGSTFCAGKDVREARTLDGRGQDDYGRWNRRARDRIQRNVKPVIAAVNGPAVGGGAYLATSCDLIVAKESAVFVMKEVYAGNSAGGAHMLTIGRARALELALLGRRLSARQAEEWGLINRCVPDEGFDGAVQEYVDQLVRLPPLAVRYTKAASNFLLDQAGFAAWQDLTSVIQRYLTVSVDSAEARAAVLENRLPDFTGELPMPPRPAGSPAGASKSSGHEQGKGARAGRGG